MGGEWTARVEIGPSVSLGWIVQGIEWIRGAVDRHVRAFGVASGEGRGLSGPRRLAGLILV
jgi:hypothetical protein